MSEQVPNLQPKKQHDFDALRLMVEAQAKQIEELKAMLTAVPAQQGAPTRFDAVAQMLTEDIIKKKQSEERLKNEELWTVVPNDMRTQVVCNERYTDGPSLFAVKIGWCPLVVVRGHSKEECRERYNQVCGILGITRDHKHPEWTEYQLADVTNDESIGKLANLTRQEALQMPQKPRKIVPVP